MTGDVRVRWARAPRDLERALVIRERVFCEEQGVAREDELDGLDADCEHLLALTDDEQRAVATLRLHLTGGTARIGRLAVEREWRRRGIATRMLACALARARRAGCAKARLAAQVEAQALYESAGFSVESEPFQEAGITHVWMELSL